MQWDQPEFPVDKKMLTTSHVAGDWEEQRNVAVNLDHTIVGHVEYR
jgi:hypothetical protein